MVSCNVLDCVADPVLHLKELERIQSKRGLISLLCPYDWSGNINTSDKWIGGANQMGALKGDTEATLRWLLSPQSPISTLRIKISKETPSIPWRYAYEIVVKCTIPYIIWISYLTGDAIIVKLQQTNSVFVERNHHYKYQVICISKELKDMSFQGACGRKTSSGTQSTLFGCLSCRNYELSL